MRTSILAVVLALSITGLRSEAEADPIAVRSGKVVLPMTGLSLELPRDARKNATWKLSGSWSLANGGASYDGRDVIDLEVGGKLVAGSWIHVGYFDAGRCADVVKEADVTDRWTAATDLYGLSFQAAGGTWDFENELGKVPAVVLCTEAPGAPSLLLYRFFLGGKPAGEAGIAALRKDKLFERTTRAWKEWRTAPVWPTHRPEIRRRGEIDAARPVSLTTTGLAFTLPDDGFVWLARATEEGGSDMLDRMAPSFPDITLEVALARGARCEEVVAGLGGSLERYDEPPALGVPAGWTGLGTFRVAPRLERVICRELAGAALIVGLLGDPPEAAASRDFGPFGAMLAALAAAVR